MTELKLHSTYKYSRKYCGTRHLLLIIQIWGFLEKKIKRKFGSTNTLAKSEKNPKS
jgi:hypothetical protein